MSNELTQDHSVRSSRSSSPSKGFSLERSNSPGLSPGWTKASPSIERNNKGCSDSNSGSPGVKKCAISAQDLNTLSSSAIAAIQDIFEIPSSNKFRYPKFISSSSDSVVSNVISSSSTTTTTSTSSSSSTTTSTTTSSSFTDVTNLEPAPTPNFSSQMESIPPPACPLEPPTADEVIELPDLKVARKGQSYIKKKGSRLGRPSRRMVISTEFVPQPYLLPVRLIYPTGVAHQCILSSSHDADCLVIRGETMDHLLALHAEKMIVVQAAAVLELKKKESAGQPETTFTFITLDFLVFDLICSSAAAELVARFSKAIPRQQKTEKSLGRAHPSTVRSKILATASLPSGPLSSRGFNFFQQRILPDFQPHWQSINNPVHPSAQPILFVPASYHAAVEETSLHYQDRGFPYLEWLSANNKYALVCSLKPTVGQVDAKIGPAITSATGHAALRVLAIIPVDPPPPPNAGNNLYVASPHQSRNAFSAAHQLITSGLLAMLERRNFAALLHASLQATRWWEAVHSYLKAGTNLARLLQNCSIHITGSHASCLVVVSAIAQVILDPVVRTLPGFLELVIRAFVLNRASPAFPRFKQNGIHFEGYHLLIFIDAIWQLQSRSPQSFGFSEKLLASLFQHAHEITDRMDADETALAALFQRLQNTFGSVHRTGDWVDPKRHLGPLCHIAELALQETARFPGVWWPFYFRSFPANMPLDQPLPNVCLFLPPYDAVIDRFAPKRLQFCHQGICAIIQGEMSAEDIGFLTHGLHTLVLKDNLVSSLSSLLTYQGVHGTATLRLQSLQHLDLRSNKLSTLRGLKLLPHLEELILDDNLLIDIEAIFECRCLRLLSVRRNLLSSLIFPAQLKSLATTLNFLDVSANQLTRLTLAQLANLQCLNVSHNVLEQFPLEIQSMQHLVQLDVSHNRIRSWIQGGPLCQGALAQLEVANFSHNKIGFLPRPFFSLPSLRVLDISFNLFFRLPWGWSPPSSLCLHSQGNPDLVTPSTDQPQVDLGLVSILFLGRGHFNELQFFEAFVPKFAECWDNSHPLTISDQSRHMGGVFNPDFYCTPLRLADGTSIVINCLSSDEELSQLFLSEKATQSMLLCLVDLAYEVNVNDNWRTELQKWIRLCQRVFVKSDLHARLLLIIASDGLTAETFHRRHAELERLPLARSYRNRFYLHHAPPSKEVQNITLLCQFLRQHFSLNHVLPSTQAFASILVNLSYNPVVATPFPIFSSEEIAAIAAYAGIEDPVLLESALALLTNLGLALQTVELTILNRHWFYRLCVLLRDSRSSDLLSTYGVQVETEFTVGNILDFIAQQEISLSEKAQHALLTFLISMEVFYPLNIQQARTNQDQLPHAMRLFMPALLSPDKPAPALIERFWKRDPKRSQEFGRIYRFQFQDHHLFRSLMVRLSFLTWSLRSLKWYNGIILVAKQERFYLEFVNDRTEENHSTLTVRFRTCVTSRLLYSRLIHLIESLISDHYHQFNHLIQRYIICRHCIVCKQDPSLFNLEDCLLDLFNPTPQIFTCHSALSNTAEAMHLEYFAPEIALSGPDTQRFQLDAAYPPEFLAKGGFGSVYRCKLAGSETIVAMKTLHLLDNSNSAADQTNRTTAILDFFHEFAMMHQLKHPNVVRLVGLHGASMLIEFVPCGTLGHKIKHDRDTQALPEAEIPFYLKVAVDICAGLRYLHTLPTPIIHRDLRAPNIFLQRSTVSSHREAVYAKIGDFGLACFGEIPTRAFLATWRSLAPEIISAESKRYDERSDIYSLGIILWEMMSWDTPYWEFNDQGLPDQLIKKKIVEENLRPTIPKHTPPDLGALITLCWNKSPDQRPAAGYLCNLLSAVNQPIVAVNGRLNSFSIPSASPVPSATLAICADPWLIQSPFNASNVMMSCANTFRSNSFWAWVRHDVSDQLMLYDCHCDPDSSPPLLTLRSYQYPDVVSKRITACCEVECGKLWIGFLDGKLLLTTVGAEQGTLDILFPFSQPHQGNAVMLIQKMYAGQQITVDVTCKVAIWRGLGVLSTIAVDVGLNCSLFFQNQLWCGTIDGALQVINLERATTLIEDGNLPIARTSSMPLAIVATAFDTIWVLDRHENISVRTFQGVLQNTFRAEKGCLRLAPATFAKEYILSFGANWMTIWSARNPSPIQTVSLRDLHPLLRSATEILILPSGQIIELTGETIVVWALKLSQPISEINNLQPDYYDY